MADALAERDRSIAKMRAEFDREAGELRALLQAATEKVYFLQKLDASRSRGGRRPNEPVDRRDNNAIFFQGLEALLSFCALQHRAPC
jgi:hypothetical protein